MGQVKLNLYISRIDVVKLCEEIFSCFAQLADQLKIDYSFNQQIEPLDVWIDAEKIENAIFNVLSNAFKYTEEGGQIQLSIRKRNWTFSCKRVYAAPLRLHRNCQQTR